MVKGCNMAEFCGVLGNGAGSAGRPIGWAVAVVRLAVINSNKAKQRIAIILPFKGITLSQNNLRGNRPQSLQSSVPAYHCGMTGPELETFSTEINGGASIGATLIFQFINLAKAMVEQQRPWMLLRNTDTTKSVATASTWQTAIDLSTVERFNRFYGETPIKLFDGTSGIQYFRQVPFDRRLEYRDTSGTFVYDEANKLLYLNGTVSFAGTLYIDHIKDSPEITNDDSSSWMFPSWVHPLLGFYAVAINKGGVDYDDINARMAPDNRAQANAIIKMLEGWDNEKQLQSQQNTDPYQEGDGDRPGAINL